MEHHSNIVPWQLLTERTGATLRWFGLTDDGRLDLSNIDELITERTKVVSLTWVSNMLGTINPVAEIARRAHEVGALVVVDASQAVPQLPVDVQALGRRLPRLHRPQGGRPDRHRRALGPRASCSTQLPPFLGGGEMIETVTMERSTYAADPAQVRGRHAADRRGGRPRRGRRLPDRHRHGRRSAAHEQAITGVRARGAGRRSPGLTVLGPLDADERGGAISFELDGVHPHDVAPGARRARHRGPRRPPLRQAGARAVRRAELDPGVVVPLHDAGRDRRAGRGRWSTPRTYFKVG